MSEVENKTNDTDFDLIFSEADDGNKQPIKTVVRIKTNIYDSGSGITYKKTVNLLSESLLVSIIHSLMTKALRSSGVV
jgi:hypothetical protein